jgi:phospholipid/cholesterol/gamma-HCH transport system substrate-binding protein
MPAVRFVARRPYLLAAVVGFFVFMHWAIGTRTQQYHVRAVFDGAMSILSGLRVTVDGVNVGKVSSADLQGGQAIVGLGISDARFRPLHQGTTATIRFGTTIGNGTREIDLVPGPASAPAIQDGGIIGSSHTTTPVEFDQVFNTLDTRTRGQLRGMFQNMAGGLQGQGGALNRALAATPQGLTAIDGVVGELASDQFALSALVVNADRATSVLALRRPQISDVMTVAAATFDTFAARTRQVQDSISGMAPTFRDVRTTLSRLDTSVNNLDGLMTALAPGARALAPLAGRLRSASDLLSSTLPVARATIATGTRVAPTVTAFLQAGRPFMPRLQGTLGGLAPMLACVRPYTPEIAGMFENWVGFTKNYDGTSHYARIHVRGGLTALNGQSLTSAQVVASGLKYALPRPPGLSVGQPWFLPQCGAGQQALDPSHDPDLHP